MSNTLTEQTPRVYEPPRLVLPSEKETAPEGGKAFTTVESTSPGVLSGPS